MKSQVLMDQGRQRLFFLILCFSLIFVIVFRSLGLSRVSDGLLVAEVDLNLCRQMKDKWGFRMTQRLEMYGEKFTKAASLDFKPQILKES